LRRKAFSLTELLVVVAVVAVLSAILFPVFHEALEAQKKTSNAWNLKRINRAVFSYSQDADQVIPIISNGHYRSLKNVRDGQLTSYGEQRTDLWPLLLLPYLRDRKDYVDPERLDLNGIYADAPLATTDVGYNVTANTYRNQNRFPMFALNYLFLSPMTIPASRLSDATPTDFMVGEAHKFAEADDPAHTVFFTESQRGYIPTSGTDTIGTMDATRGFFGVNAPGLWDALVASDQPYVAFWTGADCSGDWCGDVDPNEAGPQTRENFFFKSHGTIGNNFLFLDGHIRFMTTLQAAAGTDYPTSVPTDGGSGAFGGGCSITDKSQYLWNLNDYFHGI
jgi:prepilin-type N-terminal cleavage/methylation domain-containing protein/prepilin-type processing-associated H-X9-DG protein